MRPTRDHVMAPARRRSARRVLLALALLAVGWTGSSLPREPALAAGTAAPSAAAPAGWTLTANMAVGRWGHTATLLVDGHVLVAGGNLNFTASRTAELYNPATGTWTATGQMAVGRADHTATLLADGRVLVAGGQGADRRPATSAELYDPRTGAWTATGSLATARAYHVALRLTDGRVLVMGGAHGGGAEPAFNSAELYDPTSGRWSAAAPMHEPRLGLAAVLLGDGRVLVAGGYTFDVQALRYRYYPAAELYDPRANRWSSSGMMTGNRADATATALTDGRVLVAGGTGSEGDERPMLATAELYDPRTSHWSATGALHTARSAGTATLLPSGRVLVAGGTTGGCCTATHSVEVYDPQTGAWTVAPSLIDARVDHTLTLLAGGSVLVTGGFQESSALSSVEVAPASIGTAPAAPPVGPPPAAPACAGPRDLLVDGTQVTLGGRLTFESVCLIHGAIVMVDSGLALRAGVFYQDATSRIDADGLPGSANGVADCGALGTGTAAGARGGALLLQARHAVVLGTLSAKGGDGATGCAAANYQSGFNGGAGGQITIEAASLVLRGTLSVAGGNGGSGPGVSGNGGAITILVPGAASLPSPSATVGAGSPGGGTRGKAGKLILQAPTSARIAALPPLPGPLLTVSGPPPRLLPLPAAGGSGPRCGKGDLDVGQGQARALQGVHTYGHVCLHDGGTLTVAGALTLIAGTISVDSRSAIVADRVSTTGAQQPPAQNGRGVPPPGAPGKPGTAAHVCCGGSSQAPGGASGGGTIALVARTVVLAGTLSAQGGAGLSGGDGQGTPSSCASGGQGAGGGAGGGLYIRAKELDLSGTIRVAGGKGGPGGHDECSPTGVANGGAHGAPGFARLIVETLRTPGAMLPATTPGVLEQVLPVDPAPPDSPAALYFPTRGSGSAAPLLGHGLSGAFLTFYRRYGGLDAFGYPRSEPVADGSQAAQYTDRFLLQWTGSHVATAPLGRTLTAGRTFPRLAPFTSTSTQLYVAATGHSLSGRFLDYWRTHHGDVLLGPPIAEPDREANGDGSGRTYLVQWFERGRLEDHPEQSNPRYQVLLGLCGKEALQARGWLP